MDTVLAHYVPHQMLLFMSSSRCCQQLSGIYRPMERQVFLNCALTYGIRVLQKLYNGVYFLRMHKRSCMHYLESPVSVRLHPDASKELSTLLTEAEYQNATCELYLLEYLSQIQKVLPTITTVNLPLGLDTHEQYSKPYLELLPEMPIKDALLDLVQNNQVLITCSRLLDLSVIVPHMLLTDFKRSKKHCRILCVEEHKLLAHYNSERAAAMWGEELGKTVACQYALHSCISTYSQIIYTTTEYTLRLMMGKKNTSQFQHFTHIVLADVQLHCANTIILLRELRDLFEYRFDLRLIILPHINNTDVLKNYFAQSRKIELECLQPGFKTSELSQILHLDETRLLAQHQNFAPNNEALLASLKMRTQMPKYMRNLDNYLDMYESAGESNTFDAFITLVRLENENINYQHSKTGKTALIIAAEHNNAGHLRVLLQNKADYLLRDNTGLNAVSIICTHGNIECMEVMNQICRYPNMLQDNDPSYIDFELIVELIYVVANEWPCGNMLVFLPNYEHLLKLQYRLIRKRHLCHLGQNVATYLLHEDMNQTELDDIMRQKPGEVKIILSTEIGELFFYVIPIAYVIDSSRGYFSTVNNADAHRDDNYYFICEKSSERRRAIIDYKSVKYGIYFRLITRKQQLPAQHPPEIFYKSLERVCLTVKFLAPQRMIAEYLEETITQPDFQRVLSTIVFLKKTGILNELEDVTWLGVRVFDLPVDFQLGKMLIYAILMQCLDPVLTIVAFLWKYDPLRIPNENHATNLNERALFQLMCWHIKQKRIKLEEGVFSDHLVYLRLYQQWQNKNYDEPSCHTRGLQDEHKFVVDGLIRLAATERTQLVAYLRSAQLVHSNGCFNMTNLNARSNSWPLIKAVIAAGLYPHILIVDHLDSRFKCNREQRALLHPECALRKLKTIHPDAEHVKKYKSACIAYSKSYNEHTCYAISGCTVISAVSVVLFNGPANMYNCKVPTDNGGLGPLNVSDLSCNLYLDEWLWFMLKPNNADILLKMRKCFNEILLAFVTDCGNPQKLRKLQALRLQNEDFFRNIENLLVDDDAMKGCLQPENVGLRPKAAPHNVIAQNNACNKPSIAQQTMTPLNKIMQSQGVNIKFLKQSYFISQIPEVDHKTGDCLIIWLRTNILQELAHLVNSYRSVYIFIYNVNRKMFEYAYLLKMNQSAELEFIECFRNKITLEQITKSCAEQKIPLAEWKQEQLQKLPEQFGEIILYNFAYFNSLLHEDDE